MREQREDQVRKATFLDIEENSYKKLEKSTDLSDTHSFQRNMFLYFQIVNLLMDQIKRFIRSFAL